MSIYDYIFDTIILPTSTRTDRDPTTDLKPFALDLSQFFVTLFVFRLSVGSEALE